MGILKRLLQKLSLFPGIFGLGFICLLLATILSDLSPFILQKMIDGPLTALSQGGELGALYPMGVLYLIVLAAVKENYQVSVDLSAVGVVNQKKFSKTLKQWQDCGINIG